MFQKLNLIGKYFLLMTKVFTKPDKPRLFFKHMMREMFKLGFTSIPIVAIISLFIGAVIALQMALNFDSPLLPKIYIGLATREVLLLEFSSTVIALILAGKVGSNIASEIGSMRITEQIDAMEIMGLNSANYLILPKVVALVIFNPFLTALSSILGIIGGGLLVDITQVIRIVDYINGIQFVFNEFYVFYGIIKMAVFSIIITTIPAFYGYYASGGSLGVGQSSTRSIVASSVFILVFDLILTQLLLQ
jgi:phospholipid/cholesterol/gamma-HCH transport system permease protein